MTYVPTCTFIFELVDKMSNKYAVTVTLILCAWHEENIDIMLEWVFGRILRIDNNLKTYEYFQTKLRQFMAKSHM